MYSLHISVTHGSEFSAFFGVNSRNDIKVILQQSVCNLSDCKRKGSCFNSHPHQNIIDQLQNNEKHSTFMSINDENHQDTNCTNKQN